MRKRTVITNLATPLPHLLKKYGIRPKKGLGQSFLVDVLQIRKIIQSAEIEKNDTVLEVGPGPGTLTYSLLHLARRVIAIEKDKKLADFLKTEFSNYKNLEVISGDILTINFEKLELKPRGYKIVSNLPFYLTNYFLRKMLEEKIKPSEMTLVIQKEVAERIIAKGNKESILSLSVKMYGEAKLVDIISPEAFYPPPDVSTAIIKIKLLKKPRLGVGERELFFRLIKAGFSAKRRQLKNSLAGGLGIDAKETENVLSKAKIDTRVRAEDLRFDDWVRIMKNINRKALGTLT